LNVIVCAAAACGVGIFTGTVFGAVIVDTVDVGALVKAETPSTSVTGISKKSATKISVRIIGGGCDKWRFTSADSVIKRGLSTTFEENLPKVNMPILISRVFDYRCINSTRENAESPQPTRQ
jgi:hypothetical protein